MNDLDKLMGVECKFLDIRQIRGVTTMNLNNKTILACQIVCNLSEFCQIWGNDRNKKLLLSFLHFPKPLVSIKLPRTQRIPVPVQRVMVEGCGELTHINYDGEETNGEKRKYWRPQLSWAHWTPLYVYYWEWYIMAGPISDMKTTNTWWRWHNSQYLSPPSRL